MRCLTLADALTDEGAEIFFASKALQGNFCAYVEQRGYTVFRLPDDTDSDSLLAPAVGMSKMISGKPAFSEDAEQMTSLLRELPSFDWLIVDHYSLDIRWERHLKGSVGRLMVIDDLASRPHDCDLLLDQNFYGASLDPYQDLVAPSCRKLLGTRFVLLRPEFDVPVPAARRSFDKVERILIFFGASDAQNETLKALQAVALLGRTDLGIDVVLGANHPFKESIHQYASNEPAIRCHAHVDRMADLMMAADLYLGAAGTTTWERCRVGLPGAVIAIAENQIQPCQYLDRSGIIHFIGPAWDTSVDDIRAALQTLLAVPDILKKMSLDGMALVDGQGTARCVSEILNYGDINEG
jgi:UDP-2,4-diacetamido-2,4,6-trideoxy-beta-L-altropyranose hydrolase